MSSGYASRLSDYKDKGICGLPEMKDSKRTVGIKIDKLVQLWKDSTHVVVLTGAGISTSAGIPDFRGKHGIWTLEEEAAAEKQSATTTTTTTTSRTGKKRKRTTTIKEEQDAGPPASTSAAVATMNDFSKAEPTLTHRAISKLVQQNMVQFCITQNVDGLHRRSGLSRDYHSVLHGCVFTEVCEDCQTEHFRDYDVGGMSFQRTGRHCEHEHCKGALRDVLLDWEDQLPEQDLDRATEQCERADLVVCLGTSLRIEPAGSLPTLAKKMVIVNFQKTPYDNEATLIVRAPVDDVMNEVMTKLGFPDWDDGSEASIERLWKPPSEQSTKLEE